MQHKTRFAVTLNSLLLRTKDVAPEANFHSRYYSWDNDLSTLLKEYERKPFVYFLVSNCNDQKYVIYVGKSSDQSNRISLHKTCYEYDELYLFSVPVYVQNEIEKKLIIEFSPIYNIDHNKSQAKELYHLGIKHGEYKSKEIIKNDIQLLLNNRELGTGMYFLPLKYILALQHEAEIKRCDAGKVLSDILEKSLPNEVVLDAIYNFDTKKVATSELVTSQEYAEIQGKSVEQIKVHCRNSRIPAIKQGRDWLIPRSAPYPEDRRCKENKR